MIVRFFMLSKRWTRQKGVQNTLLSNVINAQLAIICFCLLDSELTEVKKSKLIKWFVVNYLLAEDSKNLSGKSFPHLYVGTRPTSTCSERRASATFLAISALMNLMASTALHLFSGLQGSVNAQRIMFSWWMGEELFVKHVSKIAISSSSNPSFWSLLRKNQ